VGEFHINLLKWVEVQNRKSDILFYQILEEIQVKRKKNSREKFPSNPKISENFFINP